MATSDRPWRSDGKRKYSYKIMTKHTIANSIDRSVSTERSSRDPPEAKNGPQTPKCESVRGFQRGSCVSPISSDFGVPVNFCDFLIINLASGSP